MRKNETKIYLLQIKFCCEYFQAMLGWICGYHMHVWGWLPTYVIYKWLAVDWRKYISWKWWDKKNDSEMTIQTKQTLGPELSEDIKGVMGCYQLIGMI